VTAPRRDLLDYFSLVFGLAFAAALGAASGRAVAGLQLFLLNLGVSVAALLVLPRLRAAGPLPRLVGVTLPLLVFYIFYLETQLALSGPAVRWRDAVVAGAELPRWSAMTATAGSAVLGESLAFAYMAYVPMLVAVAVTLLAVPGTGPLAPAESFVRRVCLAWAVCFVIFVLVPVLGPRFLFPELQATRLGAGPFSALARINQSRGMLHGGSFPSAHMAATTVAVWSIWRRRHPLRWAVAPLSVALAVACVYLTYHYVVDVLAGIVVGAGVVTADGFLARRTVAGARKSL
jgi:membrane-associated phospholipid phosphatase